MLNKTEYLLTCLAEECAEVQQLISKCVRFGFENYNPHDKDKRTNYEELKRELDDIDALRWMLQAESNKNFAHADSMTLSPKIAKVLRYMDVSRECGTLDPEVQNTSATPKPRSELSI